MSCLNEIDHRGIDIVISTVKGVTGQVFSHAETTHVNKCVKIVRFSVVQRQDFPARDTCRFDHYVTIFLYSFIAVRMINYLPLSNIGC